VVLRGGRSVEGCDRKLLLSTGTWWALWVELRTCTAFGATVFHEECTCCVACTSRPWVLCLRLCVSAYVVCCTACTPYAMLCCAVCPAADPLSHSADASTHSHRRHGAVTGTVLVGHRCAACLSFDVLHFVPRSSSPPIPPLCGGHVHALPARPSDTHWCRLSACHGKGAGLCRRSNICALWWGVATSLSLRTHARWLGAPCLCSILSSRQPLVKQAALLVHQTHIAVSGCLLRAACDSQASHIDTSTSCLGRMQACRAGIQRHPGHPELFIRT
jgi:hypothetical protein